MGERQEPENIAAELLAESLRPAVHGLFANLPAQFEGRYAAMRAIRRVFHQELAKTMEPSLRQHVTIQPQATPRERSVMTGAIAAHLYDLGLSLACPATGRPADMLAVNPDMEPDSTNQYYFVVRDSIAQSVRTAEAATLPELRVIEKDSVDTPPLFHWRRKTERSGPQR